MKVKVNLKNCYGINNLKYDFEFNEHQSTYAIYAPNGVMKTSFAKTFDDYSCNKSSVDLINPQHKTEVSILTDDDLEFNRESVLVIKPYDKDYLSSKASILLVNDVLKKEYEKLYESIFNLEESLLKKISSVSGLKKGLREIVHERLSTTDISFSEIMLGLKDEIMNEFTPRFSQIKYSSIFNKDVKKFLDDKAFRDNLVAYVEKYEELLQNTRFLKVGFDHYNATTVYKSLKGNNYFKANHTINLVTEDGKTEVSTAKELEDIINQEKESVLSNDEIKAIFNKIDSKISNASLRTFRELIFEKRDLIPELLDIEVFERKVWIDYFKENKDEYQELISLYITSKDKIEEILDKASSERTKWEEVIDIFNNRFFVPFKLKVINKEDSILKDEAPAVGYYHKDSKLEIKKDLLTDVLSQGELRALYLLNIIFEIESRKAEKIHSLLIVDDIADSFDYKNKYAIIQYLKEMANDEFLNLIILTHNFDFYRTIQERLDDNVKYDDKSLIASRNGTRIEFSKVKSRYVGNPFKDWKKDLTNDNKLIASIPFARNICEYIGKNEIVTELTSILHMKEDTKNISVADIESKYKVIFADLKDLNLPEKERRIYEVLIDASNRLSNETIESLNLEKKIVLSIGIRLKAEEYMIKEIKDIDYVQKLKNSQTGKLFGKFKKLYPSRSSEISLLDNVNLMTPENIHLNSFMFEPILDLSTEHLKKLYKDVCKL